MSWRNKDRWANTVLDFNEFIKDACTCPHSPGFFVFEKFVGPPISRSTSNCSKALIMSGIAFDRNLFLGHVVNAGSIAKQDYTAETETLVRETEAKTMKRFGYK